MLVSLTAFSQTKKLQEQFGFWRIHQIQEFYQDTIYNEQGQIERVAPSCKIIILREGIDGQYNKEVSATVYGNVNKTIEYLSKEPEYVNFKIVE